MQGHNGMIKTALWSVHQEDTVLSGGSDEVIRIWDLRSGNQMTLCAKAPISSMEFSKDRKYLVSTAGNEVTFWNAHSFHPIKIFSLPFEVNSASLHPDNTKFIAGGSDFWVHVYDFNTGNEIEVNKGHHGPVNCCRYSPDGQSFASGPTTPPKLGNGLRPSSTGAIKPESTGHFRSPSSGFTSGFSNGQHTPPLTPPMPHMGGDQIATPVVMLPGNFVLPTGSNVIYVVNNQGPNQVQDIQGLVQAISLGSTSTPSSANVSPTISRSHSTPASPNNESMVSSLARSLSAPQPPKPQEKYVPLINGKSITELLKTQSFEDILTNVMQYNIKVHREIKAEEVEFGEVMASGASGKVHKGRYQGKDVAIKVYSSDNICFSREEFDREVSIMSLLDHDSFTEFYGANTEKKNYLFHVSELVKGGCLRDTLLNKDISMTYPQQMAIALDVAHAMTYLHAHGVIHRDLKSGNVLLAEGMKAKVIDFGTSRAIDPSKQMTMNLGTSCWMAPEVFRNEPYTELCDVYSFGIVLWEIYCRKDPYDGVNSWSIPVMVCKGERPPIPSDCPSDLSKLIKECWQEKAKKRPKFKEIVSTLIKINTNILKNSNKKTKK
eukprot:gene5887-6810_t